jgi:hypothetical protein
VKTALLLSALTGLILPVVVETTNAGRLDYNLIQIVPFSLFAVCVKVSLLLTSFQQLLTKSICLSSLFSERLRDNAGKLMIAFSLIPFNFIDELLPKLPINVDLLSNGPCSKLLDFG